MQGQIHMMWNWAPVCAKNLIEIYLEYYIFLERSLWMNNGRMDERIISLHLETLENRLLIGYELNRRLEACENLTEILHTRSLRVGPSPRNEEFTQCALSRNAFVWTLTQAAYTGGSLLFVSPLLWKYRARATVIMEQSRHKLGA